MGQGKSGAGTAPMPSHFGDPGSLGGAESFKTGTSGASPNAISVSGSGYTGLNQGFKKYEGLNDKAMGYNQTTSFGGKDVNIDSAYADQKGSKEHLKFMLGDMAQKQAHGIDSFKDWGFNPEQSMATDADMWKDALNKQMFKQWLAKQNSLVGGNMFGGNNGQV